MPTPHDTLSIIDRRDDPIIFSLRVRSERLETFPYYRRYMGMAQGDIWYVTFGPDKTDEDAISMVRTTRTFKSEVDAKLFAMQILAKGWVASAGTLNPHQPKQVIGSSQ